MSSPLPPPGSTRNDYGDGRWLKLDSNWVGGSRFCQVHKIIPSQCSDLEETITSTLSIHPSSITPGFHYHVPVIIDDYHTLASPSGENLVFRRHHHAKQVAEVYCNTVSGEEECSHASVEATVLSAPPSPPPRIPRLLLDVSLGKIEGWTNFTPHPINLRRLRMWEGETPVEAAMAFCWYEKCPDVVGISQVLVGVARQYLGIEGGIPNVDQTNPRVVVSLTSLPGRLEHLTQTLNHFLGQSKVPDGIYINLPMYSEREGKVRGGTKRGYTWDNIKPLSLSAKNLLLVTLLLTQMYSVPENLQRFIDNLDKDKKEIVALNSVANDYGPATKLLPTLLRETDPSTIIVTVDDDVIYPTFYLEELYKASVRYPDKAVGYKGYIIQGDEEYGYVESNGLKTDTFVDVLGGFLGVAYRRAFFHAPAMLSYIYYPAEAFYVDDDYISGQLGIGEQTWPCFPLIDSNSHTLLIAFPNTAGRGKVVLGNSRVGDWMFNTEVIAPVSQVFALNGKRAFRNKEFQRTVIEWFEGEGAWRTVMEWEEEFYDSFINVLDMRKDSFKAVFDVLLKMEKSRYNIIETGTTFGFNHWVESGQSTLMWDRFINTEGRDGSVISVDLDGKSCEIARTITSGKVNVIQGDSVEVLTDLASAMTLTGELVDLIYLDSWDVTTEDWEGGEGGDNTPAVHALRELKAVLPRLSKGGVILVDDNMLDTFSSADQVREMFWSYGHERPWVYDDQAGVRGKGRLVKEYMDARDDCKRIYYGWQIAWVC